MISVGSTRPRSGISERRQSRHSRGSNSGIRRRPEVASCPSSAASAAATSRSASSGAACAQHFGGCCCVLVVSVRVQFEIPGALRAGCEPVMVDQAGELRPRDVGLAGFDCVEHGARLQGVFRSPGAGALTGLDGRLAIERRIQCCGEVVPQLECALSLRRHARRRLRRLRRRQAPRPRGGTRPHRRRGPRESGHRAPSGDRRGGRGRSSVPAPRRFARSDSCRSLRLGIALRAILRDPLDALDRTGQGFLVEDVRRRVRQLVGRPVEVVGAVGGVDRIAQRESRA